MSLLSSLLLIVFMYGVHAVDLEQHWCSGCDDPHMHTFDGLNYEFQFSGDYFLMFTDFDATRVTTSYRPCTMSGPTPTCNCGVHVRLGNSFLYWDTCGILPNFTQEFYFTDSSNINPVVADCGSKIIPAGQETDDAWWNNPANPFVISSGELSCAKSGNLQNTYFIRTNNLDSNKNIYVKLMLHDRGISCVFIRPSYYAFNNSGGLCGYFNENQSDDLFTMVFNASTNQYDSTPTNEAGMSTFWKLSKTTSLGYLVFDNKYCPCDAVPTANDNCTTIISACPAAGPFSYQNYIHSYQGRKTQENNAADRCKQIFTQGKLDQALQQGLISQEQYDTLKRLCLLDFMATGDDLWAINQVQIGQNWALETCVTKPDPLCLEFKKPAKCLFSQYTGLLNDGAPFDPCPIRSVCPAK